MNNLKNFQALETLINSEGGLHFSAYVVNRSGAPSVRSQIEEAIKVAAEDIRPVLSREDRKKFLRPLHALLYDDKTISTVKGNIGIFRSKNFFRVLHVPVHVEEYSTVASSFHVKPLLLWMQEDRAFRLLIVSEKMSGLYSGTRHSLRHLDSFIPKKKGRLKSLTSFSKFWKNSKDCDRNEKQRELLSWLEDRLSSDSTQSSTPLFLVASKDTQEFLLQHLSYKDIRFLDQMSTRDLAKVVAKIRSLLKEEVESTIGDAIYDISKAEALDLTESNVFKIARDAKRGLVKKLFVAADRKLFGKLTASSGNLILHPADIDHEDEDVLDDIAQEVMRHGGKVYVAPIRKIPGGHPLLAVSHTKNPTEVSRKVIGKFQLQKMSFEPLTNGALS